MSLMLIESTVSGEEVDLVFLTNNGVRLVRGSRDEVARLALLMRQTAVLANLIDTEEWLDEVAVGETCFTFGLLDGRPRVRISSV